MSEQAKPSTAKPAESPAQSSARGLSAAEAIEADRQREKDARRTRKRSRRR